jgi:hypothetical protein
MANSRPEKFKAELIREHNKLSQNRNEVGKRFLFVEADLALTFCRIAKQAANKTRATAGLKKAEEAFNSILKARPQLVFSADEVNKLDESLARLHEALTECVASRLSKPAVADNKDGK